MSVDKSQPDLDTRDASKNRVEARFPISILNFDQSQFLHTENGFHRAFLLLDFDHTIGGVADEC